MESRPFSVLVSVVGGRPKQYTFDQDKVQVGRGMDCDLRIEHAGISRSQFLLERGIGSQGEARFRITPFESTNPTLVNERPAVEGTVVPGDVIAISEIRIVLERKIAQGASAKDKKAAGEQISPLRMALLTGVTLSSLWLGYLFLSEDAGVQDGALAEAKVSLFADSVNARCPNPIECATRARDAYTKGKALYAQSGADQGNLYRSALEFDKAKAFLIQANRPPDEIQDLKSYSDEAHRKIEAEFNDARFRLNRAMAQNDQKRALAEADNLARLVPDDKHPYRVMLDAYRRTLVRQQENK